VPRLQRQADAARLRAHQAGATAAELQPGDALMLTAAQFQTQGRVGDALDRLTQAMTSFATAEGVARARAAQAVAPPPPPPPPSAVPPPAPVDPRPGIEQAIAAYARALESRSIDAVRTAYPGLTRRQEQAWRNLFQAASTVRADLRTERVELSGSEAAEVAVTGTLEFTTREGRQRNPLPFQASVARRGATWVITEIR
jgi:hypothetical protein